MLAIKALALTALCLALLALVIWGASALGSYVYDEIITTKARQRRELDEKLIEIRKLTKILKGN